MKRAIYVAIFVQFKRDDAGAPSQSEKEEKK